MNDIIDLLAIEKKLYEQGITQIAGVDEVGRGPLAGPVVAAAVILPQGVQLEGVNDSKKLTAKKRDLYYKQILETAVAVGVGVASVAEIDEINILQATKLAMRRAVAELKILPEYLLIDHLTLDIPLPQQGIVKGDAKSLSIASASIVAKVIRDKMMQVLGEKYPAYGFEKNAGYGTKVHREALATYGYIEGIHRLTFEPIKSMIATGKQGNLFESQMEE